MKILRIVVVLFGAGVVLGLLGVVLRTTWQRPVVTNDDQDTFMIKLRYEVSNDLVGELEGFHTGQVVNVRCNDGVVRPTKIALLDRGQARAGIILVQSHQSVGGNMGAVAYDPRGMGFVRLAWLRDHLEPQ